ncbi:callose synthase 10-like [Coffea arabica]|uniref:Callose synthase 10-like n=1 Tax=Coffea arabica TaxID=13443 RepID=A0ABM4URT1_COFAR
MEICRSSDFFYLQKDNLRNQRENVVLALANAQSRLSLPIEADPKIDEKAVKEVFLKVLDNYIKWCRYLRIRLVYNSLEAINRDRQLFLVSLYFCIWGEAANVRFLPECICYIFHHMARELDAILDHGEAHPASNFTNEDGVVSYLEQVICPIYKIMQEIKQMITQHLFNFNIHRLQLRFTMIMMNCIMTHQLLKFLLHLRHHLMVSMMVHPKNLFLLHKTLCLLKQLEQNKSIISMKAR